MKKRKKHSTFQQIVRYRPPSWLTNKYFVVGVGFMVFVTFFDSFNIVERVKLSRELKHAHSDLAYYQEEIVQIKQELDELMVNDETAEKFAREHYLMKRDNEDVFVILPAEKK